MKDFIKPYYRYMKTRKMSRYKRKPKGQKLTGVGHLREPALGATVPKTNQARCSVT